MRKLIIFLFMMTIVFVSAQQESFNDFDLLKKINIGNAINQLMYREYITPTASVTIGFAIDYKNNFVFSDNENYRFVIFDEFFHNSRIITYEEIGIKKHQISSIIFDNTGFIFLITNNNTIMITDKNYKILSILDSQYYKNMLIDNGNYHAFNENLYIGNNYNETMFKLNTNTSVNSFNLKDDPLEFRFQIDDVYFPNPSNIMMRRVVGIDINKNYYISGIQKNEYIITIYNNSGSFITSFIFPVPQKFKHIIAPNGDIYQMIKRVDGIYLYQIKNTWDPEAIRLWEEQQNKNTLTALSVLSLLTEPKDKNAYHPVKLFDNNPKTMWIENQKGPGIGEKISFSFDKDITIDKITFQPGCFWDKYWKQNYRVKKMRMKLDGKNYTLDFDDEMKDQGIAFNEPINFSDVELIIEAVYESTKWEDTAISGIKFFLNGEEIKIDTSKFAEGFEVKK